MKIVLEKYTMIEMQGYFAKHIFEFLHKLQHLLLRSDDDSYNSSLVDPCLQYQNLGCCTEVQPLETFRLKPIITKMLLLGYPT
jgi:hypothetical protein